MRGKTINLLQLARMIDELLNCSNLALSITRITKKQVRSERHTLTQTTTENLGNRNTPLLPENIQTGKLDRREHLRPVVVERRGRIRDQESQLFQPRRIV